ncbi:MAG: hypothetical protein EOM74_05200 [Methanomicrobia archaeon]|nr:hypothetical protein [Methanomicrobia archaeon]
MSKLFKVGGFFIGVGILTMVGAGIASGNWSDLYGSTNRYNAVDPYHSSENITMIDIDASNRRIVLAPTNEETVYVTYFESDFDRIEVTETNEVLKIMNPIDWQARFIFSFDWFTDTDARTIYVYIPISGTFAVDAYTQNGAISMANIENPLTIQAKTLNGSVNLNQLPNVASVKAESSNGSISVTRTVISGSLDVKTSNGSITISTQSSASTLKATTSNGFVRVSETTATSYEIDSSNGSVELSAPGPIDDYYVSLHTNLGSVFLNGVKTTTYNYGNIAAPKQIDMSTNNGDVKLRFVNN